MKKMIAMCICFMMLLCPISTMAQTEQGVLTLPEEDGTLYPVRGVSYGYNNNETVEKVIVPENIIRLGDEVFLNNTNLREIDLHSKIQKIGKEAFAGTAYYNDFRKWENGVLYIEDCLIKANADEIASTYEIRPGTRLIAKGAFEGCENLQEILLPETIEYVGEDAFAGTAFYNNSENWENDVLVLGDLLIKVSENYTGVLEVEEGIQTIADGAAKGCTNLKEVVVPESMVHIGENAFLDCTNLKKVTLGKNVETLGRGPFFQCDLLTEILVNEENIHFEVVDGILFDEEFTAVVKCPQQLSGQVLLPETVSVIQAYAFAGCENLKRVILSDNCVFLGYMAFSECESLSNLTIPPKMEYIDHYAFTGAMLEEIMIPDHVKYLGKGAFANCENLKLAVIGNGIPGLQEELFENCHNLEYVQLGKNLTYIERTAFKNTKFIYDIRNYKNGVFVVSDQYLLKVAPDVVECEVPEGVEVIADGAFEYVNNAELKKIHLPKSLKAYNRLAFNDVSEDVKISYSGSIWEFTDVADGAWHSINLVTSDFRKMTIWILVLAAALLFVIEMILQSNKVQEEEDDEDE